MAKQEVKGCVRIGTHFHWLLSAHIWLLLHETDLMLDGQNTVLALEVCGKKQVNEQSKGSMASAKLETVGMS